MRKGGHQAADLHDMVVLVKKNGRQVGSVAPSVSLRHQVCFVPCQSSGQLVSPSLTL